MSDSKTLIDNFERECSEIYMDEAKIAEAKSALVAHVKAKDEEIARLKADGERTFHDLARAHRMREAAEQENAASQIAAKDAEIERLKAENVSLAIKRDDEFWRKSNHKA